MNVLFISSSNIIAGNLARVIQSEGHNVKLFIDDDHRKLNFENMVTKTPDWKAELNWVGKKGLIIFDDIGYGKIQDDLRRQGFSVFGGCELGDKLETDRQFAQQVFKKHKIKTLPTYNFSNISDCIKYIKRNKKAWVIKQNGNASKHLNYVSICDDSRDAIDILENYACTYERQIQTVSIQERIKGIEIAVGRFFNGNDWVGPIELNIEHKKLFPGDLGPATSEMGTLAWHDDNENNRLYRETLAKLTPFLRQIQYKGDIDLNCIVNDKGAFPLEATPRLGSPIIYLQTVFHKSPWGDFLKAIADGQPYALKWRRGFGVVILLAVAPFPYCKEMAHINSKGVSIFFDSTLKKNDFEHIHFEGVAMKTIKGEEQYYISDTQGYVLYVTALSKDAGTSQAKALERIKSVQIPKVFYRRDISSKFIEHDCKVLKKWGYL
jgi:phosphoribosylamine--glycine ligase